jgi:ethanolamine utilization protein EutA
VASAIENHLAAFGLLDGPTDIALALHWSGAPNYRRLRGLSEGITKGLRRRVAGGLPIYLMIDADIALTLGTILRNELSVTNDLLILDGIALRDFDFVDLGRVRHPSNTVPVTIKSLVFAVEQAETRTPVAVT